VDHDTSVCNPYDITSPKAKAPPDDPPDGARIRSRRSSLSAHLELCTRPLHVPAPSRMLRLGVSLPRHRLLERPLRRLAVDVRRLRRALGQDRQTVLHHLHEAAVDHQDGRRTALLVEWMLLT